MRGKMKYLFIVLIIGMWACSGRPEPNLFLFNPEAFAFDLGDSWEVNSSVNVKGFAQIEKNDEYLINLSYTVDLVTPNQDSLFSIYNESLEEKDTEEFMDVILEAQIDIDSTFGAGNYQLIYNVTDEYSKQIKSIEVDFNLSK
jgi:hypothetical protein